MVGLDQHCCCLDGVFLVQHQIPAEDAEVVDEHRLLEIAEIDEADHLVLILLNDDVMVVRVRVDHAAPLLLGHGLH